MKLFRYGAPGAEKPGMLDNDGNMRDLSAHIPDLGPDQLSDASMDKLRAIDPLSLPPVEGSPRFGPCIGNEGRFICIGLNYSDHAAEAGMKVPEQPIVFMKVCPATGPNDRLTIPKGSEKTDWEVELGVIIGTKAQHVSTSEALNYVAGYCVINDISERAFQTERGGQWVKGKSCDGFGPIGPYLVTRDTVPDPQDLAMYLDVNGEECQLGHTSTMVFTVAQIISHLSEFFPLQPGDIISTGTPPGVGMGMKPPVYLKTGDTMTLGIDGLGEQNQAVIAFRE